MAIRTQKRAQRSPNYPLRPLDWAISTALEILEKEGLHAIPADIVAQHLGYKDATNGKAKRVLANLKAFGVIEKSTGGKLAVSQDVQRYKLVPSIEEKIFYLKQWVNNPLLYRKLIEKYGDDNLPSDAVLLFEMVDEHGFNESAAENAIKVFRDSVNFAYRGVNGEEEIEDDIDTDEVMKGDITEGARKPVQGPSSSPPPSDNSFRYPIRLAGGRMAWIDVPVPFFENDKAKLRAQIEIIGTDDEDIENEDIDM